MAPVENQSNAPSPRTARSRASYFGCRLTFARRHVFSFVCLVALATSVSTRLHGQQGLPIVQQPGGGNGTSPIFVDANQYMLGASGDACLAIQRAIGQMQTQKNGVVDARGITGPYLVLSTCSETVIQPASSCWVMLC
jgi:hypothetical protein